MTGKKNHTWCEFTELRQDSSSGVEEGGTGLLDLNPGGSVCRFGVYQVTRAHVGEGCGF